MAWRRRGSQSGIWSDMGIEKRWVEMIDSPRVRGVLGSRAGRRVVRSPLYRFVVDRKRAISTRAGMIRRPDAFDSVESCFAFIGHTKSGGSLAGALLDAHEEIICSDELGLFRLVESGYSKEQMFYLMEAGARKEALKGRVTARRLEPYSLAIPGLHQGSATRPVAVGDTRAGPTTRQLASDPSLIDRAEARLGDVALKFVHVIRNPFDPIAAMVVRGHRSVEEATIDYLAQCRRLVRLGQRIGETRIVSLRYEDLVCHPSDELVRICGFLGIGASPSYLASASSIVDGSPRQDRLRIEWSREQVTKVEGIIRSFEFLGGYDFGGPG